MTIHLHLAISYFKNLNFKDLRMVRIIFGDSFLYSFIYLPFNKNIFRTIMYLIIHLVLWNQSSITSALSLLLNTSVSLVLTCNWYPIYSYLIKLKCTLILIFLGIPIKREFEYEIVYESNEVKADLQTSVAIYLMKRSYNIKTQIITLDFNMIFSPKKPLK